jgi:acyl-CoA thioesterase FadM
MLRNFDNCLAHRNRLFAVTRRVTLGKVTANGSAYFAQFFLWSGEAREELLAELGFHVKATLHTSSASMKYFHELKAFDVFEIIVWPEIRRMSISLRFFFVCSGKLIAIGDQDICVKANGELVPLSGEILHAFSRFMPEK